MVTLINKTRKIKVYNLAHPFFRSKKWGAKSTTIMVVEEHRDGTRHPRQLRRSITGSLTLLAGEKRTDLPDQIQAVPEIRKALKKGILVAVKQKAAEPAKTAKAAPAKSSKRNK